MISYTVKFKGIDEQIAKYRAFPGVIEKATVSALNKLGTQAVTIVKRAITDVYNVKSGVVAKAIDRIPARASRSGAQNRLWTTITSEGRRISLFEFGVLPSAPPSQKGIPVKQRKTATIKILRKAPRRPVSRDRGTGNMPFVARTRRGQLGLWVRSGEKKAGWKTGGREALRFMTRSGITGMFAGVGRKAIAALAEEKGPKLLTHELQYYFERELNK